MANNPIKGTQILKRFTPDRSQLVNKQSVKIPVSKFAAALEEWPTAFRYMVPVDGTIEEICLLADISGTAEILLKVTTTGGANYQVPFTLRNGQNSLVQPFPVSKYDVISLELADGEKMSEFRTLGVSFLIESRI